MTRDTRADYIGHGDAFAAYSAAMRRTPSAIIRSMVDPHAPDENPGNGLDDTAPYFGNTGLFDSHIAANHPLIPPNVDYQGNLPVKQQPKIMHINPWESPEKL
jgi:hypothetical protein